MIGPKGGLLDAIVTMRARYLVALSLVVLGGCLPHAPTQSLASSSPEMRPERFFAGQTEGRGELTLRGRSPRPFRVQSEGTNESDGGFRLDQIVTYEDGEITRRTWRIRPLDGRTYTGTLSDASGEMRGTVEGNVFHVRYRVGAPAVYMEQWLYLQGDDRSVVNRAVATILGVPWARLEERIVRRKD